MESSGLNLYREDKVLQGLLGALLPPKDAEVTFRRLDAFGELCGGRLNDLITIAHRDENLPRLVKTGPKGERIDKIEYCPEQIEARRLAMTAGVLQPTPFLLRMAMAYLLNQNGEGGITCPLAMTDGMIGLLEEYGTSAQRQRWIGLLTDPNVATPLTAGQMVTEKQGGSNVSENQTVAEPAPDGTWRLTGLKWFCSNPGEAWVTTAKPKGTDVVGLFLVPRTLPDGNLNEAHIMKLKDLSGTRGKATAEIEYRGAYAEAIGRPSQGIAILLRTVLRTSRIHVAVASLGMMRRALLEAQLFTQQRIVLGKPAAELPAVKRELAAMETEFEGCAHAVFDMLDRVEKNDPAAEVLIPLLKIGISERASAMVRRARLLMAGHAALRDYSILPRLAEDALIQEIWEGTGQILAGHVAKALRREGPRKAFENAFGAKISLGKDPSDMVRCCLADVLQSRIAARR